MDPRRVQPPRSRGVDGIHAASPPCFWDIVLHLLKASGKERESWERIFANHLSDKVRLSEALKDLLPLNNKPPPPGPHPHPGLSPTAGLSAYLGLSSTSASLPPGPLPYLGLYSIWACPLS